MDHLSAKPLQKGRDFKAKGARLPHSSHISTPPSKHFDTKQLIRPPVPAGKKRRYQRLSKDSSDHKPTAHSHQEAIHRKAKLLKLEEGSAQQVPASPSLHELDDTFTDHFHSPANKGECSHNSNIQSSASPILVPVDSSHPHRPLHSRTVKRALDFSHVPQVRQFDEEWLARVMASRRDHDSVVHSPPTPPRLSVSTLLGHRAVLLPENSQEVPASFQERPDIDHLSILQHYPREE